MYPRNPPSQSDPPFLRTHLTSILSVPHTTFLHLPASMNNTRLGHGPIDLFSTRFANTFAMDATGLVCGQEVKKEGLKRALVGLRKVWGDEVNFEEEREEEEGESGERRISTAFSWTPRCATGTARVNASAT
ncbi:hypothetical protein EUX98_g7403 [Antrodiella citrinella]|uniref:Uncharacterized protein n=1 Tax=Antrodiella citrinella TaxID=2447956 RepID=A0A4S4MLM2_9APHY|nr:hypothetical protein EUX98_g7403 [Antrodiella citrinella]